MDLCFRFKHICFVYTNRLFDFICLFLVLCPNQELFTHGIPPPVLYSVVVLFFIYFKNICFVFSNRLFNLFLFIWGFASHWRIFLFFGNERYYLFLRLRSVSTGDRIPISRMRGERFTTKPKWRCNIL